MWSVPPGSAHSLLVLLLQHLDGGDGPLVFGIDETLERRRGAKIRARAIYRDPVRSSRSQVVKASGYALDLPDVAGPRALGRTPKGLAGAHGAGAFDPLHTWTAGYAMHKKLIPTGPARWSCNCAAGCPTDPW